MDDVRIDGSVIVTLVEVVHEFASVVVTVYVPATKPDAVAPVAALDQT